MFEKILVPLDGSKAGEWGLDRLEAFLTAAAGEIVLFTAIRAVGSSGRYTVDGDIRVSPEQVRRSAREHLEQQARRWQGDRPSVRIRIDEGEPVDAILLAAREEDATAIAMATQGRSAIARWRRGSVAESVLRKARIPVVLVHSFAESSSKQVVPAVLERGPFRRILVAVDGSEDSMAALPAVAELARLFEGVKVDVLLVDRDPIRTDIPDQASRSVLDRARQAFAGAGIEPETLVRHGHVAATIRRTSSERQSDLVVMAVRDRRRGLGLRASRAERVLRRTRVPLLVVPGSE